MSDTKGTVGDLMASSQVEPPEQDERLSLSWSALLIVLLPLAVFFFSDRLISGFGVPDDLAPPAFSFSSNAEASGRVRLLATFLLLVAASVAVVGHFAVSLGRLDSTSRRNVLAIYLLVVGVGSATLVAGQHRQTQELVGQRIVCTAMSLPGPPVLRPAAGDEDLADPRACRAPRYLLLRRLMVTDSLLLLLAIPAIVLGAVTGLARCSKWLPAERQWELRRLQIEHLNMVLYLAAMLLVSGLLFLGALLNWPGFALEGAALAAYRSHVSAILLFYGVTYSVLLASYYVPAFMLISHESPPEPCAPDAADQPDLVPPLVLLRSGAAMFAPVVVGLLGDVVSLPV